MVPPVGDGVQIQELGQPPDVSVGVSVAFGDDPADPLGEAAVTPLRIMYYGRMLEITLPSSETVCEWTGDGGCAGETGSENTDTGPCSSARLPTSARFLCTI